MFLYADLLNEVIKKLSSATQENAKMVVHEDSTKTLSKPPMNPNPVKKAKKTNNKNPSAKTQSKPGASKTKPVADGPPDPMDGLY
jgi:hypothetical protein